MVFFKLRASHLLVATEEEAIELRKKIVEEGCNFAQVAKEVSLCPSKKNGGDLGYFTKDLMVKPFERVAFSMEIGEISEPVKTRFGWHLIYLTDKIKVRNFIE